MSRALRFFRVSSWLGAATLALGAALMALLPRGGDGLATGFATPIVAFEFVATEAEVRALMGSPRGPRDRDGSSERMRAFDAGNQLDFVFLLAYGAFLCTAALGVITADQTDAGRRAARRARLVPPLALMASAADAYENLQLFALTAAAREGSDMTALLQRLAAATWLKWGSLLVAFYALAPWLWQQGWLGKTVVAASGVGMLAAALTPLHRGVAHEVMASAVFAMFTGLLLIAFRAGAGRLPGTRPHAR